MKIGSAARHLGTTPRTLRFYEELGLLQVHKTAGGTRDYSEADLARLEAILELTRGGIPVEQVRRLAMVRTEVKRALKPTATWNRCLAELHAVISAQRRQLERWKTNSSAPRNWSRGVAAAPIPRPKPVVPECPVARHREELSLLSLLWEQPGSSAPDD